ncbi:MAG: MFS transporter, partial [Candidatus Heimdallarchaeota archaeon]|nr:MFS transporter [Candidatus Heimdallarchaeota archaeon]
MNSIKEESGFNYKPWFMLTFLLGLAEGLIGTFFPLVFIHFGGTNFELGLFVGIISLLGSFQIFWGRLIDRFEVPKKLALSSLVVNSATSVGMALAQSSNAFAISRSVNGLSNSAFANGDYFLRTAYFPVRDRGKTNNYFMAINLFGVSTAITIAGFIYDSYGFGYANIVHLMAA